MLCQGTGQEGHLSWDRDPQGRVQLKSPELGAAPFAALCKACPFPEGTDWEIQPAKVHHIIPRCARVLFKGS